MAMPPSPVPLRLFPDANLFVAAVKGRGRPTDTLRLLSRLVRDEDFELIGDGFLLVECERYAEAFRSVTGAALLSALVGNMTIIEPAERFRAACAPYITTPDPWDIVHAATCLESGAILISNDRHFDRIAAVGLIHRLTLSEAVRALL